MSKEGRKMVFMAKLSKS